MLANPVAALYYILTVFSYSVSGIIKPCFKSSSVICVSKHWTDILNWESNECLTTNCRCQSYVTQTGPHSIHSCRVGRVGGCRLVWAHCFRATFSTAKTPSLWHSVADESVEPQWSRLMERHGNDRHLARVHPTSSLSLSFHHHPSFSLPLPPPLDAGTYFPQTDWKPLWTNNGCTPV